jgi:hypothetical protein
MAKRSFRNLFVEVIDLVYQSWTMARAGPPWTIDNHTAVASSEFYQPADLDH